MGKLVVSEWITLDGVFDADTFGQWFMPFDSVERQESIVKGNLEAEAGIMGRKTYQMLSSYWAPLQNNEMGIANKLNSMPKYVVSTTLDAADWNNTTIISENVDEEIKKLKEKHEGIISVSGSAILVDSLIKAGLVDELQLLVHPIIAGNGKKFYSENWSTDGLKLIETQTLPNGVLKLTYES